MRVSFYSGLFVILAASQLSEALHLNSLDDELALAELEEDMNMDLDSPIAASQIDNELDIDAEPEAEGEVESEGEGEFIGKIAGALFGGGDKKKKEEEARKKKEAEDKKKQEEIEKQRRKMGANNKIALKGIMERQGRQRMNRQRAERDKFAAQGRKQFEKKLIAYGLPIPGKSPSSEIQRWRMLNQIHWNGNMHNGWPFGAPGMAQSAMGNGGPGGGLPNNF